MWIVKIALERPYTFVVLAWAWRRLDVSKLPQISSMH
jgi:hypothetical protein